MKMTLKERFWAKVVMIPEHLCWEWISNKLNTGYGVFKINRKIGNKLAHRLSYEWAYCPIPKGLHVCHKCDNPGCVRPEHLFVGTRQDNMDDKVSKNRQARLCGELNPTSKFSRAEIESIRSAMKPLKEISELYGISVSHASNVRNRRRWSHI